MELAELPRSEWDNFNTPDLEQTPDSVLQPGQTLEDDFDVSFRKANAHGGRIGFGDGSITPVRNKSKNIVGKNLKLLEEGKLYHLRLGADKKVYFGTKKELATIFKNRKTSGGDVMARLEDVKNPKGYLTQKQFQEFLKKNNINAQSSGSSFAKNHGVNTKVNPLQKNALLYDTSQFTEEFIETVQKAQVKSGVGTDFAKDKFPPKPRSEINKIREAQIEAQGGIKKNSPFAGKKKLKVDLGHTGDYKTELVTGDKLAYTPSKVNSEMGKKGNLDDKIRAVKKRQNKALETLEGDELKKILNETDATLTRLADQSSGFKNVVLSNGKKYGGERLTMDPFNIYPGKTEVEIRDIQKKYLGKDGKGKTIITEGPNKTSAAEIQKIQDAVIFEENRKSNLKTASKISKTQQKGIIEKLNASDFKCKLANGLTCNDPRAYTDSIKENMAKASRGDKKAISNIKKMGKLMNGFKGAAKWTGWGLLGEIGFAAPLAGLDYAKGANTDEIISNATYGLFGKSQNEQLQEKYSDYGQAQKFKDTYDNLLKQENNLKVQGSYRNKAVNQQRIKDLENKLSERSKEFAEVLPPSMGFKGDFNLDNFFRRQEIDQQRDAEFAAAKQKRSDELGIIKSSTGLEALGFAEGGLAGLMKKYYD